MGGLLHNMYTLGFPGGSNGKEYACNVDQTWVRSLGWEDPLEEGMATHSSILAWSLPRNTGVWRASVHAVTKGRTRLRGRAQHSTCTIHFYYIMVNHLRRAPHAHHSPLSVPEILALPSSSLLLLLLLPPPLLFPNYLDQRQHQATTPITAKTFLSGVSLIQCPRQGESSKPVLSYQPDMSY